MDLLCVEPYSHVGSVVHVVPSGRAYVLIRFSNGDPPFVLVFNVLFGVRRVRFLTRPVRECVTIMVRDYLTAASAFNHGGGRAV